MKIRPARFLLIVVGFGVWILLLGVFWYGNDLGNDHLEVYAGRGREVLQDAHIINAESFTRGNGIFSTTGHTPTHTSNRRDIFNTAIKEISKCPSLTAPHVTGETQEWQPITNGSNNMYAFSAFIDNIDSPSKVRVIGLMVQEYNTEIFCHLWYGSGVLEVVRSNIKVWGLQSRKFKYVGIYLFCRLPTREIPQIISLASHECGHTTCALHIHQPTTIKRNFTVCLPPFNYQYGRAYELVEMIEGNRMFGAEYFVFYNYSVNTNVQDVLQKYVDEGLAEVVQWHLPMKVNVYPPDPKHTPEIDYFAQTVAINDCMYRTLYQSNYLVVSDLDELIVPRIHENWSEMLNILPESAVYTFRNVFFRLEWPDVEWEFSGKTDAKKYNITFILKQTREKYVFPSPRRSKCILRPKLVDTAGKHKVIHLRRGAEQTVVNKEIGLLHHYRNWQEYNDTKPRVIDKGLAKFQDKYISRIVRRWATLSDVPKNIPRYWEKSK